MHSDVLDASAVAMARARLGKEAPAAHFRFVIFLMAGQKGALFYFKKTRPGRAATQRSRRHRERPRDRTGAYTPVPRRWVGRGAERRPAARLLQIYSSQGVLAPSRPLINTKKARAAAAGCDHRQAPAAAAFLVCVPMTYLSRNLGGGCWWAAAPERVSRASDETSFLW